MIVPDGQSSDEYFYTHDHLHSPVALLDDAGDVLERYEYDAYGKSYIMDATNYNFQFSHHLTP